MSYCPQVICPPPNCPPPNINSDEFLCELFEELREKYIFFPHEILIMALSDVIDDFGPTYSEYKRKIKKIIESPVRIKYATVQSNRCRTKEKFWLIRKFVNISDTEEYIISTTVWYKKKEVLTSDQFLTFLNDYCKNQFKDEVICNAFTGTKCNKQLRKIDLGMISLVEYKVRNPHPNDVILFQFRKNDFPNPN